MRRIVFALATLSFAFSISAQQPTVTTVPNLIRYGGTLKDANGAPIAAATGVTFAIYKLQDGGAPVWMETQNVTPDSSGQYSVLLGSTTATGLPSDLFSQQEQRWLGVLVQGQTEQPRVLLVSVPYAFKAHEAETLGGKSISDFVLAKDANSSTSGDASSASQAGSSTANYSSATKMGTKTGAASAGPTNFSGSTTDQIVRVTQTGTGAGIIASSSGGNGVVASSSSATTANGVLGTISGPGVAIFGQAYSTSAQAYGVEGMSASNIGIGLLGFATATTGSTYGLKGYSSSTGGTGVRGLSTATTGVTAGISASVASPAGIAGVFNNAAGGKILSGQNNGAEKFSVDASGNVNSTSGTYEIGGSSVLGIGSPSDGNLFLGVGAGTSYMAGSGGMYNTFSGYRAGFSNITGYSNVFSGYQAGYSNTLGVGNVFSGYQVGYNNTTGVGNVFSGYQAGYSNTTGFGNVSSGYQAGYSNTTGGSNTFSGLWAGYSNTTGTGNTFSGVTAGYSNTTGEGNTFFGKAAGYFNTSGSSNVFYGIWAGSQNVSGNNNIYIGNVGLPESNTIRIGGDLGTGYGSQTGAYIAGIYGASTSGGSAVFVDSTGKLGTGSGSGGLVVTSVIQNYTSSVDISCPSGYMAVLASCQAGVNVVLNDANSPVPPGGSSWADYLTPSVSNATGVHCNVGPGNQSQAQLRCAQQ